MSKMPWDNDAKQALSKVPLLLRPLARSKVEALVRDRGGNRVALADVKEAEARFRSAMGGRSEAEMARMMPQPNDGAASLVVVDICQCEMRNCPNTLINPLEWKGAIEKWAKEADVSERLRERVNDELILHHHKLRISISGCPNGCSRPQIADVGLMGYVVPDVDGENCTMCGICAQKCPDMAITVDEAPPQFDREACRGCLICSRECPQGCITVSAPGVRVLMGGKLGRHPHLAEQTGTAALAGEVVEQIDAVVNAFLNEGLPGERFADFWIRTHTEE